MKNVRKLMGLVLGLGLALGLMACSSGDEPTESSSSSLDKIQESGVMVFATAADYPPFEFHAVVDGADKVVGFEVEVARLLAEELGASLDIQDVDFNAVLSGIETGMYDIALAGINPTPERAEAMDFSDIYYEVDYTVLINKDMEGQITSTEDLEGISLGVQTGTVQADVAQANFQTSNITQLGKVTDLVLQLQSGMIDAIILEVPVAESYEKNNDDVTMVESIDFEDIDFESGVAMAVPKGDTEMLEYINDFIERHTEAGTFDELYKEAVELNEQAGS